jgi:hypothetical protein
MMGVAHVDAHQESRAAMAWIGTAYSRPRLRLARKD